MFTKHSDLSDQESHSLISVPGETSISGTIPSVELASAVGTTDSYKGRNLGAPRSASGLSRRDATTRFADSAGASPMRRSMFVESQLL